MLRVTEQAKLVGSISVPGDKSISHRAVMLAAISRGISRISGFLNGGDCWSTIACFRAMGVDIECVENLVSVSGCGLRGLRPPETMLDAGNSGTTMRLLSGILAGQTFRSVISGDPSLCRRPMDRVALPLIQMGAAITGQGGRVTAPLAVQGGKLRGIAYHCPVASAQVKSAILLAGLYADTATTVHEPLRSRDHTERMLRDFGAVVTDNGLAVTIQPMEQLYARDVVVPGDISSAAFLMAAAAAKPGSDLIITNVGCNPTRTGIVDVLRSMGADIVVEPLADSSEPRANIRVRGRTLRGTIIDAAIMPRLVDEIPIIAVLAMLAEGDTVVSGAAELRVKESDRLAVISKEFTKFGGVVEELPDGLIIKGSRKLRGACIDSRGDHRIAMAGVVAGLYARGQTCIQGASCMDISFPGFMATLATVTR